MKLSRVDHLTLRTRDFYVFKSKSAYIRAVHGYTHSVLHGLPLLKRKFLSRHVSKARSIKVVLSLDTKLVGSFTSWVRLKLITNSQ